MSTNGEVYAQNKCFPYIILTELLHVKVTYRNIILISYKKVTDVITRTDIMKSDLTDQDFGTCFSILICLNLSYKKRIEHKSPLSFIPTSCRVLETSRFERIFILSLIIVTMCWMQRMFSIYIFIIIFFHLN